MKRILIAAICTTLATTVLAADIILRGTRTVGGASAADAYLGNVQTFTDTNTFTKTIQGTATNANTVGGELPAALHDAANLTGTASAIDGNAIVNVDALTLGGNLPSAFLKTGDLGGDVYAASNQTFTATNTFNVIILGTASNATTVGDELPSAFEDADAAIAKTDEAETLTAAWDIGTATNLAASNLVGDIASARMTNNVEAALAAKAGAGTTNAVTTAGLVDISSLLGGGGSSLWTDDGDGSISYTATKTNGAAVQITAPAVMAANAKVFTIDRDGSVFSVDEDGDAAVAGIITSSAFDSAKPFRQYLNTSTYSEFGNTGMAFARAHNTGSTIEFAFVSDTTEFDGSGGDLDIYIEGGAYTKLDKNGGVAIGTAAFTPSAQLHVDGAIALNAMTTPAAYTNVAQFFATNTTSAVMCLINGAGSVTVLGRIDPTTGHETIPTYNVWTGEGKVRDIDALIDAVGKIANAMPDLDIDMGAISWDTTHSKRDWDVEEGKKVAKRDGEIAVWETARDAYNVYTNTTLPAYIANTVAYRSEVAAHKAWVRRGEAYAKWLAMPPNEDVDTDIPPKAGHEPTVRAKPEHPEVVGEPGPKQKKLKAAKKPKWLKDYDEARIVDVTPISR